MEIQQPTDWPVQRILVVDDDAELCELIAEYLKPEGFEVQAVHNGKHGVEQALTGEFALIVLDVMLPGLRGFDALRRIRARSATPVIMLTARGDDVDRILGLESGADDYVPKPFNPRELAARIQAVLRRATATGAGAESAGGVNERIALGDVELDRGTRSMRRGNREVELTSVEFDLLAIFLKGPGRVIPRDELVKNVLGRELAPFDRSIDVHVSNLRRKLGPTPDGAERIKSIRSVGYVYTTPRNLKSR
jgi:two-component system, OmpR family, response regulator CpxR